ncbi:MAG: restriction endonuclease, partial [Blastocatellia bacterium]|nr:restriction endonuclease [Blastocatellia bacterium]
ARRIAAALATARRGGEQPTPAEFRAALRDTIRECIYGVDLNPLAVELCKVALWLEAQSPGEPLNFLDHHIKCGNAIVGFLRREDLERGIPDEAFAKQPGEETEMMTALRKRNKKERTDYAKGAGTLNFSVELADHFRTILARWRELSALPETSPLEVEAKKSRYEEFTQSADAWLLHQIACLPIAQFYLPRTAENRDRFITDAEYRDFLGGFRQPLGQGTAAALAIGEQKRFFHWFLEFPDIIERGGFDCILGNPPYLGGSLLSGNYGYSFCRYVTWEFSPTGLSDLVVFFVRRIFSLLRPQGFTAFITTNSIKDGDIRKDGLEQIVAAGGVINFALRGIKWPGHANLVVSLVGLHNGNWKGNFILDGKAVGYINVYFEDTQELGKPVSLFENKEWLFEGSKLTGDGFLMSCKEREILICDDDVSSSVILPILNGDELNNSPNQKPDRWAVFFANWSFETSEYYKSAFEWVKDHVKPYRDGHSVETLRKKWWLFERPRHEIYNRIKQKEICFVAATTTKFLNFSALQSSLLFTHALKIFATDRWDLYTIVQSTIHEVWARKYSGSLETRLRYSPTDCFETFPFPKGLWTTPNPTLATIGERYHEHRRELMLRLWLGLTDIYNLFHNPDLTPEKIAKVSGKPEEAETGMLGILRLRDLHRELDEAVLAAYGWSMRLEHGFHEVETLPENDRVRYTISPAARKEILSRLLAFNHERHAEELEAAAQTPSSAKGKKAKPAAQLPLLGGIE